MEMPGEFREDAKLLSRFVNPCVVCLLPESTIEKSERTPSALGGDNSTSSAAKCALAHL